jgi:hypothetical protein
MYPELFKLASSIKGIFVVAPPCDEPALFDYHCPIMSLPLALKTTLDTIPNEFPYLSVAQDQKEKWAQKLGKKTKPRIGIVCSTSKKTKGEFENRSIPLDLWMPVLDLPFEFHLLQKEIEPSDAEILKKIPHLLTYISDLEDFSDTAALIENMDLVISADTAVAHLTGALGLPLWVMIPWLSDHRWLMERSDSPWYKTATLFRQKEVNNWKTIMADVGKQLADHFADWVN